MNAKELREALDTVSNPQVAIQLMALKNQDAGTQSHREVIRLFHNFLTGAITLVDQARVFINEHYIGTQLATIYAAEVENRFAGKGLHEFVKCLRNFMLHKGLPKSEQHITYKKGKDFECGIRFSREDLKDYNGWNVSAREYLSTLPDKIALMGVCSQYEDLVLAFHKWLDGAIKAHHQSDLNELERLQAEYEEKYGRHEPLDTLAP